MNIEDAIKRAMVRMLERKYAIENVQVIGWTEEFEKAYFTGCQTCGNGADEDSYYVDIWYNYSGNNQRSYYRHEGSFAELIRELDTE